MTEFTKMTRRTAVGLAAAAAVTTAAPAFAGSDSVDMSGKTIEWTIPFSEKGGSAKWAFFFAPLLSEALPGNPTVVVKFMPGAGSTKGANWFPEQTNGDGTVMFGSSGSTQFPYLLGDPRVRYEYNDWEVVMASGTGGVAYLAPDMGATVVMGLTFTTANDATERDPVTYELSGSNGSIDGPYELIASGEILDFAQDAAWPRRTMNATPISFENTAEYTYYQLMFPTVRDAGGANSMQIAEVELLGRPIDPVLLYEDFEGLALGPNVDEALAGDQVWTDTPPEGWAVDESGVPGIGDPATDGVTEWAGWAFADKAWWSETAGDQRRSEFELASGTVAVADPDEWDDAPHDDSAAGGWYKTFLRTPEINIAARAPGSLWLIFDSSWRPEFDSNYHQTANVTVSYDGGTPVEVLLWESDEASASYKPPATNETVVVDLQNPAGAQSLVLTFGLFDAGNDWWWAIDNVEVTE